MTKLKKIGVIVVTVSAFTMPNPAAAQDKATALNTAQIVQTQMLQSAEQTPKATPKLISPRKTTRSIKRVVIAPVPTQASEEQLQKRLTLEGVFNATNSGQIKPTRFVYDRVEDDSRARILFDESSLSSK